MGKSSQYVTWLYAISDWPVQACGIDGYEP